MVNGLAAVAPPEMLTALVFCTANVLSSVLPNVMEPKLVVPVGVTLKPA
jgi:hypothetical protein